MLDDTVYKKLQLIKAEAGALTWSKLERTIDAVSYTSVYDNLPAKRALSNYASSRDGAEFFSATCKASEFVNMGAFCAALPKEDVKPMLELILKISKAIKG